MSPRPSKRILFIIAYPLDWQWVISAEYLYSRRAQSSEFEVITAGHLGERNLKAFIRWLSGGNNFQKKLTRKLRAVGFSLNRAPISFSLVQNFKVQRIGLEKDLKDFSSDYGPAYNSIVEKSGNLDIDSEKHAKIIIEEIIFDRAVENFLARLNPDNYRKVITVNGRFTKNARIAHWAKANKLDLELLEFGSTHEHFEVYEKSPHSMHEIEKKIKDYWSRGGANKEIVADEYLSKLRKDSDFSRIGWRNSMVDGKIPEMTRKKICTFYASTEAEYAGVGDESHPGHFVSQVDAFRGLVETLSQKDWQIYLRRHPKNPNSKESDPEEFLWAPFKKFENVEIIEPTSDIDSLALGHSSDLIVNYCSTIAMEFVAQGLQNVVTLGPSPWNQLLPLNFLPTEESISKFVKNPFPKISSEDVHPWAYYCSEFGRKFSLTYFDRSSTTWHLIN